MLLCTNATYRSFPTVSLPDLADEEIAIVERRAYHPLPELVLCWLPSLESYCLFPLLTANNVC